MSIEVDLSLITGLSEADALRRLSAEGYNELPAAKKRSSFTIAFEVFTEPMFLLLVACGAVYLLLGDVGEAVMLLGFVFVIMGITLYQERKTERALEALRDLSSPRALVVRDGKQRRIAGREVAREDIILLAEGDRVPADAVLLSCVNMLVDESLLTGESVPVRKCSQEGEPSAGKPGGDDLPWVFSGTLIVQGQAVARVCSTGGDTEIGKIGKALNRVEEEKTLLQKETQRLVRAIALLGAGLCLCVVVIYGITRHDWLHGFLAGITLAMAMLPEEFPVVMTIFLALGAWRISQRNVLTRRVPAVETLGSASVLCVDKTGTLTQNRMAVHTVYADGNFIELLGRGAAGLPENFHETVEFGILASKRDPFDPMEKALKDLGELTLTNTEHLHTNWTLIQEYPLAQALLAMSRVWKSPDGENFVIAAKGAPEAILDLCHIEWNQSQELMAQVKTMAERGLRVIGVAKAHFSESSLPAAQHDFTFSFLGFLAFEDPLRPTVAPAVAECKRAGIRVIMITGDYPVTAMNIAGQIGLPGREYITGPELDGMSDDELKRRIKTVNIFARVVPEQKLRIVTALKESGEVVAMTGDGVNDAPALKAAHIGIAMGSRGTDVAREASALVLVDDDFSSIVAAVRMGRRIFDNLSKAMSYIFAVHVPIAGVSLIPVIFNSPLVLLPMHVVFLELIIDPACSVVFEAEAEEKNVMDRQPRDLAEPLFGLPTILFSSLQGLGILVVCLLVFYAALNRGLGEFEARAITFTTLIIANLGLILTNRSRTTTLRQLFFSRNIALWSVVVGAAGFLALVLYVPFLRTFFKFSYLHAEDLALCCLAGFITILWSEALKMLYRTYGIKTRHT